MALKPDPDAEKESCHNENDRLFSYSVISQHLKMPDYIFFSVKQKGKNVIPLSWRELEAYMYMARILKTTMTC